MLIMGILSEQGKMPIFSAYLQFIFSNPQSAIRNPKFFLLHYSKQDSYEPFGQADLANWPIFFEQTVLS